MKGIVTRGVLVALLGILLGAGGAVAQTPMAFRNIGQRISPDDARIVGRGGWGMAIADTTHPGFKNVASLSYLRHVVVKYTGYGEVVDNKSPQGTRRTSGAYSPGLQFALPVIKNRLGVTAGFSMNRSTRWDAQRDTVYASDPEPVPGGVAMIREGTRFKVPVGVAWRVIRGLSISGTANLESGSIQENVNEGFITGDFYPNVTETKDLYNGTSFTAGALWRPFSRLSFGASYTPAYDLKVDRQIKAEGVTERHKSTWDLHLPAEYRAGMQLRFTDRWQIGGDAQFMAFSKFSGDDAWAAEMNDEFTLSAGFERKKATARRGGMNNLPFRIGGTFHRWAYGIGGSPLEEYTVSVGTGFAFARDLGQLDLSFSYSVIGDMEKNGLRSEVYRLGVSITGLESWW